MRQYALRQLQLKALAAAYAADECDEFVKATRIGEIAVKFKMATASSL